MDEQQLQQQIVQLVQAAMQGDKQATQQIQQIMQAAQQGNQQAVQIAQMIQQVAQQMQQQQTRAAKFGAKLNYIRQLKGQCPEGYKMEYYKHGGRLCKRCMKAHQDGGEVEQTPNTVAERFKMEAAKCGKKMKKKENGGTVESEKCGGKPKLKKKACGGPMKSKVKKAEDGTDLPTAPSAKIRYQGGIQGRVKNSNPYMNNSFGYLGFPRLTDYDVVQGNDGNFLYTPSMIGKGYDYQRGDSVAIEVPRHIPQVVLNTAEPVYQSQNPSEFSRLSRRVDEAKSVSKKK